MQYFNTAVAVFAIASVFAVAYYLSVVDPCYPDEKCLRARQNVSECRPTHRKSLGNAVVSLRRLLVYLIEWLLPDRLVTFTVKQPSYCPNKFSVNKAFDAAI